MDEIKRLQLAAELSEESGEKAGEIPDAAAVAASCNSWGVKAQLKFHQAEGVAWLIRRYVRGVNVILGDEVFGPVISQAPHGLGNYSNYLSVFKMGLGKTLQAIALLAYLKFERKCPGPFLILSPLSVTDGWASELARFAPGLRVMRYVGDKQNRQSMRETICDYVNKQSRERRADPALPFDVLLTTYELAVLDATFLSLHRWRYCIVDEAQRLKNSATVLYRTLMEKYMVPRRLLLTGTPIQNNLSELWALLHFCMPKIFGGLKEFLDAFGPAAAATQAIHEEESPNSDDAKTSRDELRLLRHILRAFMLRRTKAALVKSKVLSLPPIAEVTVFAPLVPIQKKVYMSILKKEAPSIVGRNSGSTSGPPLQNIVMQLRKACSHPYLFEGVEPEPFEEGEHLVEASGKLLILDMMLKRLRAEGHRVLIFAQMTRTLDIIQDYLQYRGYTYDRLDGSLRAEERFAAVRSFSAAASSSGRTQLSTGPFVFLLTTRAGGVGLNLVAADTVVFYEQDWNPQADKQALQRAHRMGQSRSVLVLNIITQNTVEEVILQRARTKLQLTHEVIGRDDADLEKHGPASYDDSEMQAMIVFGLKKIVADAKVAGEVHESSLDKEADLRELEIIVDDALNQRLPLNGPMVKNKVDHLKSLSVLEDLSENRLLKVEDFKNVDTQDALAALKSINETSQRDVIAGKRTRKQPAPEADLEAAARKKRKAEESRQAKWATMGYKSLALSEPDEEIDVLVEEEGEETDYTHFLVGDCSKPSLAMNEAAIILWCVDDSGNWGRGGVFDALSRLSKSIPEAYETAYSAGDLHLGDVHLIPVPDTDRHDMNGSSKGDEDPSKLWAAFCVVQNYDGRRKIPRSDISLSHLESCLQKVAIAASKRSASIHMPRIEAGSGGKQGWYVVERLLRKYATAFHVHFNVYYFKRRAAIQD